MNKALIIIFAIILSALLGGILRKLFATTVLSALPHYPAKLLRDYEIKLTSAALATRELYFYGATLTAAALAVSLLFGMFLSLFFDDSLATVLLLAVFLPAGSSIALAGAIKKHLQAGNVTAARAELEGTVFRHHIIMDAPSLARAAIEYLAVQFSEKIIAPIFWFLLLGLPGFFLSVTTATLQEALSGASDKTRIFGKPARDAQFLLNYIPSRLAALLWIIATAFLPSGNFKLAAQKLSPELPISAPDRLALLCAASCLNLTLGGKTSGYYNENFVGSGKPPFPSDISRAQFLFTLLILLLFIGIGMFI